MMNLQDILQAKVNPLILIGNQLAQKIHLKLFMTVQWKLVRQKKNIFVIIKVDNQIDILLLSNIAGILDLLNMKNMEMLKNEVDALKLNVMIKKHK